MKAWFAVVVLLSGCLQPANPGSDEEPRTSVADDQTKPAFVQFEGTFQFHQDQAIICPFYIMGPYGGTSNPHQLDLQDAKAIDVTFDWTPKADAFQDATMALHHDGLDSGNADWPTVSGPSPLVWHLDGPFSGFDHGGWLTVEKPYCPPDERTPRTGFDYEQDVHYRGNVTYAR
ncbi:MAG: hypothetical protein AABY18_04950 [Candidatus Thermoplasmatota archaeon]